jgi:hypothetical protein
VPLNSTQLLNKKEAKHYTFLFTTFTYDLNPKNERKEKKGKKKKIKEINKGKKKSNFTDLSLGCSSGELGGGVCLAARSS